MRLSQTPSSLLALLLTVLSQSSTVEATPFPKDALYDLGLSFLMPRQCASYCGATGQYCCDTGEGCFTSYGGTVPVAYCSSTVAGAATATAGGSEVFTTTYTETDLVVRTSTYTIASQAASTVVVASVTAAPPAICTPSLGQSSCGTICCAADQRCAGTNSCTALASSYYGATGVGSSTYSAPLKPTSGGVSTATTFVSHTTTAPFQTAATASGSAFPAPVSSSSGHGLSGGAIAGIVIGVIAAIIILLLICFCCILKEGIEGLLAIFGLGKKRRSTERVETVERYSRHGSAAGSRREHVGWFGAGRPARVDSVRKEKKSGGGLGLGAVGVGLLGLAAVLGLKRKHDRKEKPPASDISSSYYTESYTGTSASK